MFHKFTHIATYSRPVTVSPGDIQQKFGVWGHIPSLNAQVEITAPMYFTLENAEDAASLFRGYNDLYEDDEIERPMFEVVGSLLANVHEDGTVHLTANEVREREDAFEIYRRESE